MGNVCCGHRDKNVMELLKVEHQDNLNKTKIEVLAEGEQLLFNETKRALRIFHFNDVYEIEDNPKKEISQGAPRFVTALRLAQQNATTMKQRLNKAGKQFSHYTTFGGDLLSPSMMATKYEGRQMVSVFNRCNVDVAMPGNHDYDFGILQLRKCVAKMTTKENWPKKLA